MALAMDVAVTVLASLHLIETEACFSMLGIGLACVGVYLLSENDDGKHSEEESGK